MRKKVSATVCIGLALALASAAQACDKSKPDDKATAGAAASNGQSAMRVYVDPEGGFSSTPITEQQKRQAAEASDSLNFSDAGLQRKIMPDGSVMVDLEGRYQMSMVVNVQSDGSLKATCTDDAHAALGAHSHEITTATPAPVARDVR